MLTRAQFAGVCIGDGQCAWRTAWVSGLLESAISAMYDMTNAKTYSVLMDSCTAASMQWDSPTVQFQFSENSVSCFSRFWRHLMTSHDKFCGAHVPSLPWCLLCLHFTVGLLFFMDLDIKQICYICLTSVLLLSL